MGRHRGWGRDAGDTDHRCNELFFLASLVSLKGRSVQQNVEKYLAGRLSLVILCRAAPGMLCSRQEKNKIMSSPRNGAAAGDDDSCFDSFQARSTVGRYE